MKETTVQVRIKESDYKLIKKEAEERETSIARVIHDILDTGLEHIVTKKIIKTFAAKS